MPSKIRRFGLAFGCLACVCLMLPPTASPAAPGAATKPAPPRLLSGFNTGDDLTPFQWGETPHELVADHATEGGKCVKVTLDGAKRDYPGFSINDKQTLAGWQGFDVLSAEVFNPSDLPVTVSVRIDDDLTRPGEPNEYTTWYTHQWNVLPGKNSLEIELGEMRTANVHRLINRDKIKMVGFYVDYHARDKSVPAVLFFDNLALRKNPVAALPEGLKAFDFGTEASKVWPGFTAVRPKPSDAYDDARGYGFTSKGGRYYSDTRMPNELDRDGVRGADNQPMVFSVKAAPGKWRVWASVGSMAVGAFPRRGFKVAVGGKDVFTLEEKDYLSQVEYVRDYCPGESVWDVFARGRFTEVSFEAESADGRLNIAFSPGSSVSLCGLAVWPADNKAADDFMRRLGEQRKARFDQLMREIKPVSRPEPPKPTDEESARGFLLARGSCMDNITPYWVPAAGDRLVDLSLRACPGQYAPAVFTIYPTADRKGATVKVSDLKGPGGVIPAASVKVDRMIYHRAVAGDDTYRNVAGHLAPRATVDLATGVPAQFWLTLRVPERAAAGAYEGTVTISSGGKDAVVPLKVEVYPFALDKPDVTYAHVYAVAPDDARLEADLRCLVEHGFNSVTSNIPGGPPTRANGKLAVDFAPADRLMTAMKKLGMIGPVPLFNMSIQGEGGGQSYPHIGFTSEFKYKVTDQAYLDDLTELTRLVLAHAEEKQWLPVIMYSSTEISNDDLMGPDFNRKLINAIRKAGKVQVVSSVNRPRDVESVKDLDIVMYNAGVPINEKTIQAARDAGCKLWFQNIGPTRFNDGLYLLRTGAVGRRQWALNWFGGDPYSDFEFDRYTGRPYANSAQFMYPSPEGTLPSVQLERMREGVDDYRYFLTLKRLIDRAAKEGKAADEAAAAKADVEKMIGSCPVEMDLSLPVGRDGFAVNEGFKDPGTLDRYRQSAAEHIIKLQKALSPPAAP